MRIVFKTLTQKSFTLEAAETDSVLDLKNAINKQEGDGFPVNSMKLIYLGTVMNDADPLKQYNLSEKGFVVVMVPRTPAARPAAATAAATTTSAASSITAPPATSAAATSSTTTQETLLSPPTDATITSLASETTDANSTFPTVSDPAQTTTNVSASSSKPASAASEGQVKEVASEPAEGPSDSSMVFGKAYEATVREMMTMGFDRALVTRALSASFNNPDRAMEYLLSGNIPDIAVEPSAQPNLGVAATGASAATTPATAIGAQGAAGQAETEVLAEEMEHEEDPMAFLRTLPQFQQMRNLVRENPHMLPQIILQIGQSNPDLLQVIRDNETRFLEFLNEENPSDIEDTGSEAGAGHHGGLPTTVHIPVDERDREALTRITAMGFPEDLAIQAYFACDKNEEAAVNFLLNDQFNDDDV